jgi:hypothetical protein
VNRKKRGLLTLRKRFLKVKNFKNGIWYDRYCVLMHSKWNEQVLLEIFETELKYIKDLEILIEMWMKPMQSKHLLSIEQIRDIFINIEVILNLNRQMFKVHTHAISQMKSVAVTGGL